MGMMVGRLFRILSQIYGHFVLKLQGCVVNQIACFFPCRILPNNVAVIG